jgi:5-methylcytosine-specific restriction endonuclease McrA
MGGKNAFGGEIYKSANDNRRRSLIGPWLPTQKMAKALGAKHYFTGEPCFNGHTTTRFASNAACMKCSSDKRNELNKLRAAIDPEWKEERNAKRREAYAADPSKSRALNKEWIAANGNQRRDYTREYMRMRRAEDPTLNERAREIMQEKRSDPAYIEAERARDRERYAADPLPYREKSKRYAKENPEVAATHARNRRAMLKAADGTHAPEDVEAILKRQKYKCGECGTSIRKSYHVDHIHPLSKGGSNWPHNLQCLCSTCNLQKSDFDQVEYAKRRGRLI